jgi:uncharacterized protein YdcH (DUF465 family)
MTLRNEREFINTERKLEELNRLIDGAKATNGPGRDTEVRSLQQLANQLREEIIRYQAVSSGSHPR